LMAVEDIVDAAVLPNEKWKADTVL